MVLIVVLYWLDTYYQGLLFGSVLGPRFLEIFELDGGLTTYISAFFGASKIGQILHFLYVGFLIGALILGLFVATTVMYTVPENANNLLNGSSSMHY